MYEEGKDKDIFLKENEFVLWTYLLKVHDNLLSTRREALVRDRYVRLLGNQYQPNQGNCILLKRSVKKEYLHINSAGKKSKGTLRKVIRSEKHESMVHKRGHYYYKDICVRALCDELCMHYLI